MLLHRGLSMFARGGRLSPCTQFLLANWNGKVALDGGSYWSNVGTEDREVFQGRSIQSDGTMTSTIPDILVTDTLTNGGTSVLTPGNGTVAFTAGSCWDIEWWREGVLLGLLPCVTGLGIVVENIVDKDNPMTLVNAPADVWQEHIDGGGSDYLNLFGYSNPPNSAVNPDDSEMLNPDASSAVNPS